MKRLTPLVTVFASTAAYAAPSIDVDGLCPEVTLTLTGASPRREVMLYTGDLGATTTLSRGACRGTTLDIADAEDRGHHLFTARTDEFGGVTLEPASLPAGACEGGVQAIDLATCEVSDVATLAIDCGSLKDMLAYWPGNGNTRDVAGGHFGTVEGTIAYASGVRDDAFDFDGSTAIRVAPTTDLDFDDGDPYTYAMWIYDETSSTIPHHLFGKRAGCSGGATFDYQFVVQYGDTLFGAPVGTTCGAWVSYQPPTNTWQHVVLRYDGSAFSMYIDGELVSTNGPCDGDLPVLGGPLRIGSSGTCGGFGQGWIGLVDEVKLWSRALDEDEIVCASRVP